MNWALFPVGKVYYYDFQVGRKRYRKSTRETNFKAADRIARAAYEAAVLEARGQEPVPTLAKLVQMWLRANDVTGGAHHLRSVRTFGKQHLYGLAELPINQIRTEHVEAARRRHIRGNRSRSTANHWLRILKLLTMWAVRRGLIDASPWRVPMLTVQKRPRTILPIAKTADWFDAVIRFAGQRAGIVLVIRLIYGLGLRISEAVGARWEWIDWERMSYTPGVTKGKEADPVPVPSWLIEHLRPLAHTKGLIATRPDGRPVNEREVRVVMHKANEACEIHGLTPHRLRGTYATLLSVSGVPLQEIQSALRHKRATTTIGYLEKNLGVTRKALESLGTQTGLSRPNNDRPPLANPHGY